MKTATRRKFIVTVKNKAFSPFGGRAVENGDDYQRVVEAIDRADAERRVRAEWRPGFEGQPKPRISARLAG